MYKQEKQRGNRVPAPLKVESTAPSALPPRATGRRPSLRHVDSIIEDEEEANVVKVTSTVTATRARVTTPTPPNLPSSPSSSVHRGRSFSEAPHPGGNNRSLREMPSISAFPLPPPSPSAAEIAAMPKREWRAPQEINTKGGYPPRTRKIQGNRESLDLDDVMGGSDDDDEVLVVPTPAPRVVKTPVTPRAAKPKVSASTRDLMDFLAQGPPETPSLPGGSRDIDFFPDGPPMSPVGSTEHGKPKGGGRLQRMMSKLTLNGDKSRGSGDEFNTRSRTASNASRNPLRSKISNSNMGSISSLANRPVPPRPRPISPPPSATQSSEEQNSSSSLSNKQPSVPRKSMPKTWNTQLSDPQTSIPSVALSKLETQERSSSLSPSLQPPSSVHSVTSRIETNGRTVSGRSGDASPAVSPVRSSPKPPSTPVQHAVGPVILTHPSALSLNDTRDMRRLLSKATTADECRLIFDMFLAKAGIPVSPVDYDVPYPSPSPSDTPIAQQSTVDSSLEQSIVELFLGGDHESESPILQPSIQHRIKADDEAVSPATPPHTPNSNGSAEHPRLPISATA